VSTIGSNINIRLAGTIKSELHLYLSEQGSLQKAFGFAGSLQSG